MPILNPNPNPKHYLTLAVTPKFPNAIPKTNPNPNGKRNITIY
jgi:hypothetical protein